MAKHWIAGAITHPGALHKSLGVPQGQTIPASKLAKAAAGGGVTARRARLAQTLSHLGRKVTYGSPPHSPMSGDPMVSAAMREVHTNIPSTVPAWVRKNPAKEESMLRAIAFSKVRKGR